MQMMKAQSTTQLIGTLNKLDKAARQRGLKDGKKRSGGKKELQGAIIKTRLLDKRYTLLLKHLKVFKTFSYKETVICSVNNTSLPCWQRLVSSRNDQNLL